MDKRVEVAIQRLQGLNSAGMVLWAIFMGVQVVENNVGQVEAELENRRFRASWSDIMAMARESNFEIAYTRDSQGNVTVITRSGDEAIAVVPRQRGEGDDGSSVDANGRKWRPVMPPTTAPTLSS